MESDDMALVVVESPYSGDVEANVAYARRCMADCLRRGEAPFLSHLLYTQALDDSVPVERTRGINAGFAWGAMADRCVVYIDRGISFGMKQGIANAERFGIPMEHRSLGESQ